MVSCGTICAPQVLQRVVKTYPSNSRPAKVHTDAGAGFVKGLGNPAGPDSLAAELVAAELGALMGLHIPPFAVIQNPQLEVPMDGRPFPMGAPLFFSSEIEDATVGDGTDYYLKRMATPAARILFGD